MRSPASDCLSGATIGMAPPTAASNLRSTPAASAASNSSPPWVASSSLLAVTTGLPSPIAWRIRERAGSMPPITSTTTSTSGSATTSAASPPILVGSTAGSRLRVTSRTATRCSASSIPARSATGRACSTSSLATPVPTTPHPSIPILSAAPNVPSVRLRPAPILPDAPAAGTAGEGPEGRPAAARPLTGRPPMPDLGTVSSHPSTRRPAAADGGAGGLGAGFAKLWAAAAISNVGDGVYLTALPLLAATLTRDPLGVSLVTFGEWLPWLLFGLVSGALLDRWERRRVMWIVDAARFAVVGGLALAVLVDRASIAL